MKKVLPLILTCIMALMVAGCDGPAVQPTPGPGGEEDRVKTYEELYDGNAKEKYAEVSGAARYRASYGYTQNSTQGYNRWYYLGGTELAPMSYEDGVWTGSGATIAGGVLDPAGSAAALRFDPPQSGAVTVSGTLRKIGRASCRERV